LEGNGFQRLGKGSLIIKEKRKSFREEKGGLIIIT